MNAKKAEQPKRKYRVLCLDGGGMRGTYTATYLADVARTFAKRRGVESIDIGAAFDLIVGTSTGGIIACALAKGIPLQEVVTLYRRHGKEIFSRPMPAKRRQLPGDIIRRPAALEKGEAALRAALQDRLGDTTVGGIFENRGIALAISAVEMSQHRSWLFRTAHFPDSSGRDDNYSLVDVCLATSAAPVFRSMAEVDHPKGRGSDGYNVFVDGGLWANNPVLVGLIEALKVTSAEDEIHVFSMGSCPRPAGEHVGRGQSNRGLPNWKFGADAASLSIDAQEFAFDNMARMLLPHLDRECRIVRFPSEKVPAALVPYLGLDDTREEAADALVNQAHHDADMTNSRCSKPDEEAALICDLFESAPELTDPLVSRRDMSPA
ncbi:CBASS cGAMP-activated phospholipase [Pseudohoeflea coraliihabitans]|uniref:Patatin-like phospholipase family protein n=1 Tax=Pseudohoeflea coraliihabitans TaxID=2860393 RepID=A0ABS6WSB4_9HYPH|nr:CBASS cGAMP-activated phospholipase [Pseudohoeflea sp. DP4N28-3]MBW3098816.1 patatin-like phospholipase family protein [Pseudohoeflea sp. DP4N28-3]